MEFLCIFLYFDNEYLRSDILIQSTYIILATMLCFWLEKILLLKKVYIFLPACLSIDEHIPFS